MKCHLWGTYSEFTFCSAQGISGVGMGRWFVEEKIVSKWNLCFYTWFYLCDERQQRTDGWDRLLYWLFWEYDIKHVSLLLHWSISHRPWFLVCHYFICSWDTHIQNNSLSIIYNSLWLINSTNVTADMILLCATTPVPNWWLEKELITVQQ